MRKHLNFAIIAGVSVIVLGIFILGCEDQSENIPTSYQGIDDLMALGWAAYANDDFTTARQYFIEANQRNAYYLPAYNALGWCAVRLTNFANAAIQFSFVTTLADPVSQADLLADSYAGLSLSATIERTVLEISGEGTPEQFQELTQESISMAQMVFNLFPADDYAPYDNHDPGFGSGSLHLLNAQNYFYLQEFGNSETELSVVDPVFIDSLLTIEEYGTPDVDTLALTMEVNEDTSWYLTPGNPVVHHVDRESTILPDPAWDPDSLQYVVVDYSVNQVQVIPPPDIELIENMQFILGYVYIDAYAEYLDKLSDRIQELIEEGF